METRIQLTVTLGNQTVLMSTISRPLWKIGRLPDNDLVLPAPEVSQHHAEIRLERAQIALSDLQSSSGTVVDGARLMPNQPFVLKDGAAIEIGPYVIVYRRIRLAAEPSADSMSSLASQPDQDNIWVKRALPAEFAGNGFTAPDLPSAYLQYLPIIFHEDDFLNRFLQIFESIWEPLEQRQDHIEMYIDPRTCPAAFLPWFASWFDLPISPHLPEARIRAWIAEAIELYRWRGTKYGLSRMIEVCTGVKPEITDVPSSPFVFHVKVQLPDDGSTSIDDIDQLIRTHKPAHSGYLLEVQ